MAAGAQPPAARPAAADSRWRLLLPTRRGERPTQTGGGKISPQARRARGKLSAQKGDVAAESVEEVAPRSRRPAAARRTVVRLLADGFRIAVDMIRRVWHRVEPTSSMVRDEDRESSPLDNV